MSPRWLIGMAMAFLILGVFANITDGIFLDNEKDIMPIWQAISNFQNVNILNPMTYDSMYIGVRDLIDAVWQLITWDFAFLNGEYQFIRWLLITISVGIFVEFMFGIFRLVRGSG